MKLILSTLMLFVTGLSAFSQTDSIHYTPAPKAHMIINVDGQDHYLTEGDELLLDSSKKNTVLSVKLANYRSFNNSAISFSYPSDFTFEYQGYPTFKRWKSNGSSFEILYFEMSEKTILIDFITGFNRQFGSKNCTVEEYRKIMGNTVLIGNRVTVKLPDRILRIDFFEIKLSDSKSRIIAFQDVLFAGSQPTFESVKTMEMVDRTIKYLH